MDSTETRVTARWIGPADWDLVERVFADSSGCDGCWCLNHHLRSGEPDCVGEPARERLKAKIEGGKRAVVGMLGDQPAGWLSLDPRREIPGHDCVLDGDLPVGSDPEVFAVHCLHVRASCRGRGVARALVVEAVRWARDQGAAVIEAYAGESGTDHERFDYAAPIRPFLEQGFELVGRGPAPFVRLRRQLMGS